MPTPSETLHIHPQAEVVNLVSDLAAKEATANKGEANGYASLGSDGKVPTAQLPAAGSDPWSYLRLTSDFSTSSATLVDVTGLGFAPAANQRYEFEATLFLRTASAGTNPRTGFAWPTGLTDGVAMITQAPATATGAAVFASGNPNAALQIAAGGLLNATQSWPAFVKGAALVGASPSGSLRVQMSSETAGTNVTVKAGSFLRHRLVP